MVSISDFTTEGKPRFSVIKWLGGWWVLLADGRFRLKTKSEGRAKRICRYLNDHVPGPDSPVWEAVARKVLADLDALDALDGGRGA
jgi:hypothetical protein